MQSKIKMQIKLTDLIACVWVGVFTCNELTYVNREFVIVNVG